MSKRSGNFITVGELVGEVGRDAVRVHMLRRESDTHMNFDFTEVVETNRSNPVFYIQYAHARICSTMQKVPFTCVPTLEHYGSDEILLFNQLVKVPTMIERAALSHSPQQIVNYLYDLASEFHSYWHLGNVDPSKRLIVEGNDALTASRVYLARAVGQVIRNGLAIIGVTALREM
jgi:arginyl-tRNA synthetase